MERERCVERCADAVEREKEKERERESGYIDLKSRVL